MLLFTENAFSFTSLPPLFLHCTFSVLLFIFLSLSFSSGSSYRLPSFLLRGSSFFLGLLRVT